MRLKGIELRLLLLTCFSLLPIFAVAEDAKAAVAGGISLGVGEEYNDNIFFSNEKKDKNETDFITHIVPTFTFSYAPFGSNVPTLNASLSASGQIYAHNSDQNNFGKNIRANVGYTYRPAPRLAFYFGDSFSREGATRTIGLDAFAAPPELPLTPTQLMSGGGYIALPNFIDIGELVTKGTNLSNFIYADGRYLYSPNITFSGFYSTGYTNFGGTGEVSNTIGFRGMYNWRNAHNFHAGYYVTIITSNRDDSQKGKSNRGTHTDVIHNIDLGDDFFSTYKINIDPTWTISATGGVGINTSNDGPAVGLNANITMIKVWERAILNMAVRRGFGGTAGISSGPALTTSISTGFGIRITPYLNGFLGTEYTLSDSEDTDTLKTFRAGAGLQYWITNWLSSSLWYAYRFRDVGGNISNTAIASSGRVSGNAVVLTASIFFDAYPNFRLSRQAARPLYSPMGAPVYMGTELQQQQFKPQPLNPQQ